MISLRTIFLAGALFAGGLSASVAPEQVPGYAPALDHPEWRAGDLVFRRGLSIESAAVHSVDQSGYTHVGILAGASPNWTVVHVEPHEGGRGGFVEQIPLRNFASPLVASKMAVLRVPGASKETSAAAIASAIRQIGKPFDTEYRYSSNDALYCTELVLKAFADAGVHLNPLKEGAKVFLLDEPVVLPGTLFRRAIADMSIV